MREERKWSKDRDGGRQWEGDKENNREKGRGERKRDTVRQRSRER